MTVENSKDRPRRFKTFQFASEGEEGIAQRRFFKTMERGGLPNADRHLSALHRIEPAHKALAALSRIRCDHAKLARLTRVERKDQIGAPVFEAPKDERVEAASAQSAPWRREALVQGESHRSRSLKLDEGALGREAGSGRIDAT